MSRGSSSVSKRKTIKIIKRKGPPIILKDKTGKMVEDSSFNNTIEFKTNVTKFTNNIPRRSGSTVSKQLNT